MLPHAGEMREAPEGGETGLITQADLASGGSKQKSQ
jgi:hypothetical protein